MCNLTIYSLKVRMPWKCIHQHINAMMSGRGCVQCGQTFYRFKLYYVFDYFNLRAISTQPHKGAQKYRLTFQCK